MTINTFLLDIHLVQGYTILIHVHLTGQQSNTLYFLDGFFYFNIYDILFMNYFNLYLVLSTQFCITNWNINGNWKNLNSEWMHFFFFFFVYNFCILFVVVFVIYNYILVFLTNQSAVYIFFECNFFTLGTRKSNWYNNL